MLHLTQSEDKWEDKWRQLPMAAWYVGLLHADLISVPHALSGAYCNQGTIPPVSSRMHTVLYVEWLSYWNIASGRLAAAYKIKYSLIDQVI